METLTNNLQSLHTSFSSFSDVFLDLDDNREPLSFGSDFIAGSIAGSAGVLVGYPLDTIKVRQQTCKLTTGTSPSALVITARAVTREGARSLYRGMAFPLVSDGVRNSLFFGVYGHVLDMSGRPQNVASYSEIAVAAAVGGGVQGIAATPVELVKIQLQSPSSTGPARFRSPFDCVRHLYAVGGCRMLFHGANITVMREAPAFSIYMLTFTGVRRRLTPPGRTEPPLSADLVAGGVAGLASWSSTMPIDVVKSRLQSDGPVHLASPGTGQLASRYTGVVDCVVRSWRAEGISVFFRGMTVTSMRAFPTNAVILVVYVNVLRLLDG